MKVFVWTLGRNGELLDSHLFFFDRYSDLSDYHREKGRAAKAAKLAAIAEVTRPIRTRMAEERRGMSLYI